MALMAGVGMGGKVMRKYKPKAEMGTDRCQIKRLRFNLEKLKQLDEAREDRNKIGEQYHIAYRENQIPQKYFTPCHWSISTRVE